jgi:hypothetical protein
MLVEDLSALDQDEGDIASAVLVDLCDRRIHEGSRVARRGQRLTPPALHGSSNENAGPDRQCEDGGQHDEGNAAHIQTPITAGICGGNVARGERSGARLFQGTLQHLVNGHEVFQVLEDDHQSRAHVLETQAR